MGLFGRKRKETKKNAAGYLDIEIRRLIEWNEPNGEGCIVSDRITRDGMKVGYMWRVEPAEGYPDSGWRFSAGDEDETYMNDPTKHAVFALNTLCNYDPSVIPYLHAPVGSGWARTDSGAFVRDEQ